MAIAMVIYIFDFVSKIACQIYLKLDRDVSLLGLYQNNANGYGLRLFIFLWMLLFKVEKTQTLIFLPDDTLMIFYNITVFLYYILLEILQMGSTFF